MIKRWAKASALPYSTRCHTFRATGITTGPSSMPKPIANHESPRITKLYEVARINFCLVPLRLGQGGPSFMHVSECDTAAAELAEVRAVTI